MKKIILLLVVLIFASHIYAKKVVNLSGINNPREFFVDKNFVGKHWAYEGKTDYRTINLYDKGFKKINEIFRKKYIDPGATGDMVKFKNYLKYYVGKDKIYITL